MSSNTISPTIESVIRPPKEGAGEWPVFVSYRRSLLTSEIAKWLKEELEKEPIEAVNGQWFRLNVFVDALEPVHGDFQKYLVPHLEHSRMLIVITDTGSSQRRSTGTDYLYDELDWWAKNRRKTAPILLDTDRISAKSLVSQEKHYESWGRSSWLECYWKEWQIVSPARFQQEQVRLLQVIRESIQTYGHNIHLAEVRRLRSILRWLICFVAIATLSAIGIGGLAFQLNRTLKTSEARRLGLSISTADFAISNEDYAAARTTLIEAPQSLRNWEWNHLWRKADSSDLRWLAHPDGARGVVFSPDEGTLFSVGRDGCLRAWDVAKGRKLFEVCTPIPATRPEDEAIQAMLLQHGMTRKPAPFGPLALSPDGKMLAAGTTRGTLNLWQSTNGEAIATIEKAQEQSILELAFVSNETLLTSSEDGTLLAWDLMFTPPTSRIIHEFRYPIIFCLSEDRTRLAISESRMSEVDSPSTATLFSIDKNLKLTRLRHGKISPDLVSSLAYSGEGYMIVAADYQGELIFIPESDADPIVRAAVPPRLKGSELLLSLASMSGGELIASGAKDGTIKLWNTMEQRIVRVLAGHDSSVSRLCFSKSGRKLASASDDGEIRLWTTSVASAAEQTIPFDFDIWAMAVHPDQNSFAVAGHEGKIRIFNAKECIELVHGQSEDEARIDWLQYSTDGSSLVAIDERGELAIWNSTTLTKRVADFGSDVTAKQAFINPAGNIVVLLAEGIVIALDGEELNQVREISSETTNPVQSICPLISVRGTSKSDWRLALARANGLIEIVDDAGKGCFTLTALADLDCMASSHDGRFLAAACGDELLCWDLSSRRVVSRIKKPHESLIRTLAFSPDSKRLCSGSEDSTFKVWDLSEGIALYRSKPLDGIVHGLGFLNEGRDLVIAPCDSSIQILRGALTTK